MSEDVFPRLVIDNVSPSHSSTFTAPLVRRSILMARSRLGTRVPSFSRLKCVSEISKARATTPCVSSLFRVRSHSLNCISPCNLPVWQSRCQATFARRAIAEDSRLGKDGDMELRLREWRNARGKTLEQVAEALDTNPSQISRLETGERRLNNDWITRLAAEYVCTPEELLAGPRILDDAERAMLDDFRSLTAQQRDAMAKTISALAIGNKDDTG